MIILFILFILMPLTVICMEQPFSQDTKESEPSRIELPEETVEQKLPKKRLLPLSKVTRFSIAQNDNQSPQFKFAESLADIIEDFYNTEKAILIKHLHELQEFRDSLTSDTDRIMKQLNQFAKSEEKDQTKLVEQLFEIKGMLKHWELNCPFEQCKHKSTYDFKKNAKQAIMDHVNFIDPDYLESQDSSSDEESDDNVEL